MRIKFLLLTIVALSMVLATAFAADVTGTWKGQMEGMGGGQPMDFTFNFKADGATLTGTTQGPQGSENAISNGKIDGDKVSFDVKVTGKMEMTIKYSGTVTGDEMKLSMAMEFAGGGPGGGGMGGPGGGGGGMPPMELTLKKVK
jgi:autotransporter translocation and assembly factor TamB